MRRVVRYLKALGPGIVTGASDDDPSGIATYSQVGARFQLGLLWTALLTLPLMAGVQEIIDRTARVTGKGLGELAARRFDRRWRPLLAVLLAALVLANTVNITADLMAVGSGMNLLGAGPAWVWALVAGAAISTLLVTGSFEVIARVFKVFALSLLAYVAVLFIADVRWGAVLRSTLVPSVRWNREYVSLLVAVLGTTLSPYLFFWQSGHRVEQLRQDRKKADKGSSKERARMARVDVIAGMALSNLVMWSIIVTTAETVGRKHHATISSAVDAARALKPLGGGLGSIIFALGFIGTGMLAVPVLAGAGAVGLSGLFRRTWGFSKDPRKAPVFYGLVLVGTIGGTALTLLRVSLIKMLVVVAIVNGVAAAPFLVMVMLIASDRGIMGREVNGPVSAVLGWAATAVMAVAALALLATSLG